MKNITVTQPKIIKHLQHKDISYLNKERQGLSKPGQPLFLSLRFFPWTNGWVRINMLEKLNFFKCMCKITWHTFSVTGLHVKKLSIDMQIE